MIERNPNPIVSVVPSAILYAAPPRPSDARWTVSLALMVSLAATPVVLIAGALGIL